MGLDLRIQLGLAVVLGVRTELERTVALSVTTEPELELAVVPSMMISLEFQSVV